MHRKAAHLNKRKNIVYFIKMEGVDKIIDWIGENAVAILIIVAILAGFYFVLKRMDSGQNE